jgi:hypothetical protein
LLIAVFRALIGEFGFSKSTGRLRNLRGHFFIFIFIFILVGEKHLICFIEGFLLYINSIIGCDLFFKYSNTFLRKREK